MQGRYPTQMLLPHSNNLTGNEDKLVPAALITFMLTSTLAVLPTLLRGGPSVAKKPNTTRKKTG